MLRTKGSKKVFLALTVCLVMGTCSAAPAGFPGDAGEEWDFSNWEAMGQNRPGAAEEKEKEQKLEQEESAPGLTIQTEVSLRNLVHGCLGKYGVRNAEVHDGASRGFCDGVYGSGFGHLSEEEDHSLQLPVWRDLLYGGSRVGDTKQSGGRPDCKNLCGN